MRRLAALRQQLKERLEYARSAQPPESLPDAVPFAILARQCSPSYAVDTEIVDRLQEFTIVMSRLAPARLRRVKHRQHDRPILFRHPRQHGRLPDAGYAVIRTKPDSGIPSGYTSAKPSTRPRKSPLQEKRLAGEVPELFGKAGPARNRCEVGRYYHGDLGWPEPVPSPWPRCRRKVG